MPPNTCGNLDRSPKPKCSYFRRVNRAHILYLTYDGLTDPLGQSQVLPYLVGLSEAGYSITIISCEKPLAFSRRKSTIDKICADAGIRWHPLPYTKSPPVVSTLGDLKRMRDKAEELQTKRPFDLIHCRSYLPVLIALKFKKDFDLPYVFDMRGFWADERVDGGIWDLNNPVHRRVYGFFKKREPIFLREAAAVVSLTHAGLDEIIERFVTDPRFGGGPLQYNYDRAQEIISKTAIIPCAADTDLFDPRAVSDNKRSWFAAKYGLDLNREYLGYLGSLGTWYMGREMMELYAVLQRRRPGLRFLILSQEDPETWLRYAQDLGIPLSNLIHIATDRQDLPTLISFMSASVFFILPVSSKKASSPTKQGELMAMGVPVICNSGVGDTAEIVEKYRSGYVTEGFSDQDFEAIAEQWDEITTSDKQRIRRGALEYYSLKKGIAGYANVYAEVLEKRRLVQSEN